MWNRDTDEIVNILRMPEWKDDRFKKLFNYSIWKQGYKKLDKIPMDKSHL